MLILAIDSSAAQASVCLAEDDNIIGEFFINTKQKHSRTLMQMTENLLKCTGVSARDIGLFAAVAGPGSFTGVRIGVSCIKGLAFPWNTPCIGISSLHSLAYAAKGMNCIVGPVMDARCGQVYTAVFKWENGILLRLTEDKIFPIAKLGDQPEFQGENVILCGDACNLCKESLSSTQITCSLLNPLAEQNHASYTALAAWELYKKNQTVLPEALSPIYLSMPQAQKERLKKMEEKQ